MAEKRTMGRLALSSLSTNVPVKKMKENSKINNFSDGAATQISNSPQKTKVVKKFDEISTNDKASSLAEHIHREGYQKDYIRFLLNDEKNYVLPRNFLQTTIFTVSSRYTTVNLLLRMQEYFSLPNDEYYMAVKLMDFSARICIESKEIILLAITSFWVVHKFSDTDKYIYPKSILKFLHLVSSTEFVYNQQDILNMERRVLMISQFKIRLPDPSIFIDHFLKKLKLTQNQFLHHGTYFVCDCLSMFPSFSYTDTSLVAAVALYTTLVVMRQDTSRFMRMMEQVFNEEILRAKFGDTILKISHIKKMGNYQEIFVKIPIAFHSHINNYFENYIKKSNTKKM